MTLTGTKAEHKDFVLGTHMIDLRSPDSCQVEILADRLYVHVNGITVLRIYDVKDVDVRYERGGDRRVNRPEYHQIAAAALGVDEDRREADRRLSEFSLRVGNGDA